MGDHKQMLLPEHCRTSLGREGGRGRGEAGGREGSDNHSEFVV